jgi:SagB-type dehydrogenase family enzyme
MSEKEFTKAIKLPEPQYDSKVSIEKAMLERRSVRDYRGEPLTLAELSQLLWAAQGITNPRGFRTAPSAGALYPLEVYVVAGKVDGLVPGFYKYKPRGQELVGISKGDKRAELCRAALRQTCVQNAPAVLVFCAVYDRITRRYGERGIRYTFMEIGHAAQNVHLQVVSLGLETVVIGAFHDHEVKKVLGVEEEEDPLYIMPIGK